MKTIALACACSLGLAGWAVARSTSEAAPPLRISETDLRARLEIVANDSMQGRMTGSRSLERLATYFVNELSRIGSSPAGDSAGYLQTVPITRWQMDARATTAKINRQTLHYGVDFLPLTGAFGLDAARSARVSERDKIMGGRLGTTRVIDPALAAGKVTIFYPPLRANGQPDYQLWSVRDQLQKYRASSAIVIASLDLTPQAFRDRLSDPQFALMDDEVAGPRMPPMFIFGYTWEDWVQTGPLQIVRDEPRVVPNSDAELSFESRNLGLEAPARNVVARFEGSDPRLKSQYVVLSAHMDHLGIAPTAERVGTDSIYNGADDSGTGSVALLAIAEALQSLRVKPKRSIVLLWTTGEEQGFLGSAYFANHPTVPRENIVANLTIDMIGRGGSADVTGGSPSYLELHGTRRGSSALRAQIADVNARPGHGFQFNRDIERTELPDSLRCSGDDWQFARWGIPSLRVSTGQSPDFHRVTDEASKIDFAKFAKVTEFIMAVAIHVADQPERPPALIADPRRICAR